MNPIWTSKKLAVFFSYSSIILNAVATIVLTGLYIDKLGRDSYGLYQMIYAVSHYILIIDLGIGATMNRYVTEFLERKDQARNENFAFHMLVLLAVIGALIFIVGWRINAHLTVIYPKLTPDEIPLARHMFFVMVVQIALLVLRHYINGISLGYDQYAFVRLIALLSIVVNFSASVVIVYLGYGFLALVYAKTITLIASTLTAAYVVFVKLQFKIRFHYWDWRMMAPAAMLMIAVFLQSVVGHVNNTVDKTILGNMTTKTDVAVYSVAAVFITMLNMLPSTISGVFQTQATKLVVSGATPETLTDFVARIGRFQFVVAGGFCLGFTLLGQDFIQCWMHDEKMKAAWLYVLLIMIPNLVPLIQQTCVPLMNALNKRIFRSLILIMITVVNISLTIVLVRRFGAVGAPLATGISFVIGHIILINIYYHKRLGLDVFRMFRGILSRIWLALGGSFLVNLPLVLWRAEGRWWVFIVKAVAFCAVYAAFLWGYGLNQTEKKTFAKLAQKVGVHLPSAA